MPPMRRRVSRVIALVCVLVLGGAPGGTAFAQSTLDAAVLAYVRGDYPVALERFVLLAYEGEAEAQYYLGQMYEHGLGVHPEQAAAVRWYRAAAEQGHRNARSALAGLGEPLTAAGWTEPDINSAITAYEAGDFRAARDLFAVLAARGDAEAQYRLGLIYEQGPPGIERDPAAAFRWFREAAERDHAQAQYRLGRVHERGDGVAPDAEAAARWYRRAADQGSTDARFALQRVLAAADLQTAVAAYDRGDIEAAYQAFRRLAKSGHLRAQYFLGRLYERGEGVARDPVEAARWYRGAAQAGDAEAQFGLATLYEQGRGVPADDDMAYRWYSAARARGHPKAGAAIERLLDRRSANRPTDVGLSGIDAALAAYERRDYALAAERFLALARRGDAAAQRHLGSMYERGLGVATDPVEARRWYRTAAEQGDPSAQLALAQTYDGYFLGAAPDYAEAVRWYRAAAERGNPQAQLAMGHAYRDGKGVERDGTESARWYERARRTEAGVERLLPPPCAAPTQAACRGNASETAIGELMRLARQGNTAAQVRLAYLYYTGRDIPVPRNVHEGAAWYRAAAEKGDAIARYNLGVVYEHGMGVAADRAEAIRWYRAAAEAGASRAEAALRRLAE